VSVAVKAETGASPASQPAPVTVPTLTDVAASASPGSAVPPAATPLVQPPLDPVVTPTEPPTTSPTSVPPGPDATDTDGDGLTNAFETRYGATDPRRKDTNANGIIDAAEDPDGDGLSNLGEQRFGTSPIKRDTDGDGISDGKEDANPNGINNQREQDRRPIPANLKPTLAGAIKDAPPSYRDGCHGSIGDARIHPCVYGDKTGATTVALFGDSHAAQWLPALIREGVARHWKIVNLTKSGCPSADVKFRSTHSSDIVPCRTWRSRAETWLRGHHPDLIVVANLRTYPLLDASGRLTPASKREAQWRAGLTKTLRALPTTSRRVVLADTPQFSQDVPSCLSKHHSDIAACETSRTKAISGAHNAAEKGAATATGTTFVDLNGELCSYDPCPVIEGHLLMWRDPSHLTATFSHQFAPSLGVALAHVLASATVAAIADTSAAVAGAPQAGPAATTIGFAASPA